MKEVHMRNYFVWFILCATFALGIYDIKYSVKNARKITAEMEAELLHERQRVHMLEVEWTMLSRPERIAALAKKHLNLVGINPEQVMDETQGAWRVSYDYAEEQAGEELPLTDLSHIPVVTRQGGR
jgi:cell division protein FtsL